jgi:drug/metabolite transporter (DMT)-like permease
MVRLAVAELDPFLVSLGRALVAGVSSVIILAVMREPLPKAADLLRLCFVAAGVVFGFPVLSTVAMQSAPAGHGAVVLALLPLATAVASVVFAGERPSAAFWICGFAGSLVALAFAWSEGAFTHQGLAAADLLLVGAVGSAAIGYAQGGALSRSLGGWQVICWALVLSLPIVVPVVALMAPVVHWQASWGAWGGFLYVSLMSQLIGFFFWNRGLALGGVAKVGQLQLLQPFVILLGASLLAGEAIGWREIGFAIVIGGIVAIGRQTRVLQAEPEPSPQGLLRTP